MLRQILGLLLAMQLLNVVVCSTASAEVAEIALRVWTKRGDGAPQVAGTSAFVIHKGRHYIVTSYHVVRDQTEVYVAYNDKAGYDPLKGIVEDQFVANPSTDMAVFRCTETGVKAITGSKFNRKASVLANDNAAEKGAGVLVVGNPLVRLFQGTSVERKYYPLNIVASATVSDIGPAKEKIGDSIARESAGATQLLILDSFKITFGFSGGPIAIVDNRGRVVLVGLLQGGDPVSGVSSWGVTAKDIAGAIESDPNVKLSQPSHWPTALFAEKAYCGRESGIELHFPMYFPGEEKFQEDRFGNGKWWMKTGVVVSANGKLNGSTDIGTDEYLKGWRGEVIVFLCDESGNILWHTTKRHRWGVPVGVEKVRKKEPWEEQVPEDVLGRVRRVKIVHRPSPKDGDDVFNDIIDGIHAGTERFDSDELIKVIQSVSNASGP